VRFVKMQATGNDYVVLDAFADAALAERVSGDLAHRLCRRRFGVGSDGLIVLGPCSGADARMRIINADGSDGGMCGNGARCAAKFLVDRGYASPNEKGELSIELNGRPLRARVATNEHGLVIGATIDMGTPEVRPEAVPVDTTRLPPPRQVRDASEFTVDDRPAVFVSMGNPHMVSFAPERVEGLRLDHEGGRLERHAAFPRRMNVHFVNRDAPGEVRMRSWERGVGETMGCGTGACAAVVAGVLSGRLDPTVIVRMPGGPLEVEWDRAAGRVLLTGPAEEVFEGEWRGGSHK